LALTSPASGGHAVDIVCLWAKAMELFFLIIHIEAYEGMLPVEVLGTFGFAVEVLQKNHC
jgi:hypothetical protein